MLRIRDPNNVVVRTSDPVHSTVIMWSYELKDDAPIGEWNIQVGIFNGGWHWLTGPGDIAYFSVIDESDDVTPPKTSLKISEPQYHRYDNTMWVTSSTRFILHSDDPLGSGVREILYTYDGNWQTVSDDTAVFSIPSEGQYIIQWYAVDDVGNIERMHMVDVYVDNTAPDTYVLNHYRFLIFIAIDYGGVNNCTIHYATLVSSNTITWHEHNNPLILQSPFPQIVMYYSEDAVENKEPLHRY
jgi:hypothetical protein